MRWPCAVWELLRYDPQTGRYTLGIRMIAMARIAQASMYIVEVAGRYIDELADELNETVCSDRLDGEHPV